nr:reverse transcriptase domain-containing protein [Tanacetum cinerariifolium]
MRTRSSSNIPVVSSSNLSTSNPKRRNCRRSKQPFILEESPIDTMADQRTMAELLRAPNEGYAEAIVVPPILAEQFKLKHSLINMMTLDQFFRLEKDNPCDHIRGNLLERHTQDVLTIIENKSKVCNSRNKSVVSQVKSCDANSNSFSEIAKLTRVVNQQTSAVTTAMTTILKQFQATPPLASVKAVEEICVTCGGAHLYYQCLAAGGNTFPELRDNIQGYVSANEVNYHQANSVYRPLAGIARDVFVSLGKFTFSVDFVIVDYESDPRVPLIMGRPFLQTARALIDVYGEEMILRDGDKRLTIKMKHDTFSYSNQPQKESINLINVFNASSEDFLEDLLSNQPSGNPTFSSHPELTSLKVKDDIFDLERGNVLPDKLLDLDSTKDLHPPLHVNPLSGSTTSSPNPLLEELADELALITFPPKYDDDL